MENNKLIQLASNWLNALKGNQKIHYNFTEKELIQIGKNILEINFNRNILD